MNSLASHFKCLNKKKQVGVRGGRKIQKEKVKERAREEYVYVDICVCVCVNACVFVCVRVCVSLFLFDSLCVHSESPSHTH